MNGGQPASTKRKQRRNRDLDPQLVWRGKDEQDWSDLVVQAPPLYIPEQHAFSTLMMGIPHMPASRMITWPRTDSCPVIKPP